MEINDQNLAALSSSLEQTLSPDPHTRKQAEGFLRNAELQAGFLQLVLHLIATESVQPPIRTAGAVLFKNTVKRHWAGDEDGPSKLLESDKEQVKGALVNLMLSCPPLVRRQISEALSIVAECDFPAKWPTLLPELIQRLGSNDLSTIIGVLETAHSIFKSYRHQFKSDTLYIEIKFVLDSFQSPMLELFKALLQQIDPNGGNKDVLTLVFEALLLLCRIFYSLNWQDLPEFFEDHMKEYMDGFLMLLRYENQLLLTDDDDTDPGCLIRVKAAVCENINLYEEKYEEEFQRFLQPFVTATWGVLLALDEKEKHDRIVTTAISFLGSVAKSVHHEVFKDASALGSICEKVIIPNIRFRDEDEELFEDNPFEYIRRDIEGSDAETRRRAATELVRGLRKYYEKEVTELFSSYINGMLNEYAKNPGQNWKAKGTTATNEFVNITDFFTAHIVPIFADGNAPDPLRADALKFLATFRNQLPDEMFRESVRHVISFLACDAVVVHTYAAHTLERLLVTGRKTGKYTLAHFSPHVESALTGLFGALGKKDSHENEYVMKAIMRVISITQEQIVPYAEICIQKLTEIMAEAAKNPGKPGFNHFMFEALAVLIRTLCKVDKAALHKLEGLLFPPFQSQNVLCEYGTETEEIAIFSGGVGPRRSILTEDIVEFSSYVFQLLALLLQSHDKPLQSQAFLGMLGPLLTPALWERPGNVPGLARLISEYVEKAGDTIVSQGKLEGVLGIFQKLNASKANDHEGIRILNAIVRHLPLAAYESYLQQIFMLLFARLQGSKTNKFVRGFIEFLSVFTIVHSVEKLMEKVNGVQAGLFNNILSHVWFSESTFDGASFNDRASVVLAASRVAFESSVLTQAGTQALWPRAVGLCVSVLARFSTDDEEADDLTKDEQEGYEAAYAQLAYGAQDGAAENQALLSARRTFAQGLSKFVATHPQNATPLIQQGLSQEQQSALQQILAAEGVQVFPGAS